MAEDNGTTPPQPAPNLKDHPMAESTPQPNDKIVSKQPDFSGFEYVKNLEKAPGHKFNIKITLRPRQPGNGFTQETYKDIAWTASVVHLMQILKSADPNLMILRKDSRQGGNPIFEETDVPDSVDVFTRDYAYDVNTSPNHAQFNIGIASTLDYVQLFGRSTSTGRKIMEQRWEVAADRSKKLGQSVILGFLRGAHPSFVNQEQCRRNLQVFLMEECKDVDIIPKKYWYPKPGNESKRIPVRTLSISCPQDIARPLTERILQRWGQMRKKNESHGPFTRYAFIPCHHEYYHNQRQPTKNPKWYHQLHLQYEFIQSYAPIYINQCNNLHVMFCPTQAMLDALEIGLPVEGVPELDLELLFAMIHHPENIKEGGVVYHTEQLNEDTATLLVHRKDLDRVKRIVYNFVEELKLHPDYLKISGNNKGILAGRRIVSKDADDYMQFLFGDTESPRKSAYCSPTNHQPSRTNKLKHPYVTAREQLKISNGAGALTHSYSDIIKMPTPSLSTPYQHQPTTFNQKGAASTNIVIAGNNSGLVRTNQNPKTTTMLPPVHEFNNAIKQYTSKAIAQHIAAHGAGVATAIAKNKEEIDQVKKDHQQASSKITAVQKQCDEQKKKILETTEHSKRIEHTMETINQAHATSASMLAENTKLMGQMQQMLLMMQAEQILPEQEDDDSTMMGEVCYERDSLKEGRVHGLPDQETPERSTSLRRRVSPGATSMNGMNPIYDMKALKTARQGQTNVFNQPNTSTHDMTPPDDDEESFDMGKGK